MKLGHLFKKYSHFSNITFVRIESMIIYQSQTDISFMSISSLYKYKKVSKVYIIIIIIKVWIHKIKSLLWSCEFFSSNSQ